jgi:hypothetical protein
MPILAVLILSLGAQASPLAAADCLDLVRHTYAQLRRPAADGRVYRLHYTVHTVRRRQVGATESRSTVEVLLNRHQVRLTSPELVSYQDEESSITILPAREVVMIGPSSRDLQREKRLQNLTLFQDELFDAAVVESCVSVPASGEDPARKRVILGLDEDGRRRFPMRRITYEVDESGDRVRRVLMEYPQTHALDRVEITFHEIDYDYETRELDSPIRSAVFDGRGRLLEKYSDFEIVHRGVTGGDEPRPSVRERDR